MRALYAGLLAVAAILAAAARGGTSVAGTAPGGGIAAAAPAAGTDHPARIIRGKLTPPDRVREAFLWQRAMDLRVPVAVDPKTGQFQVRGLRLGTYDLVIRTPWGRLEGVDMAPKVSEYDALIPPEYRTDDLGRPPEGVLSEDDRKAVRRIIYEVNRYENKVRDIYLTGCSDRAVALVECLMDAPFHGRKGDEITWRIEQWYYEKKYDAWTTFRTRVLYRFRVSKAVWQTWGWQFEPALGGFDVTEDRTEPITVEFAIPEKPSPEKGLTGNQYPPADQGRPKEPRPPET